MRTLQFSHITSLVIIAVLPYLFPVVITSSEEDLWNRLTVFGLIFILVAIWAVISSILIIRRSSTENKQLQQQNENTSQALEDIKKAIKEKGLQYDSDKKQIINYITDNRTGISVSDVIGTSIVEGNTVSFSDDPNKKKL